MANEPLPAMPQRIPTVVVQPPSGSPPYPTVLWFHGLGVSKETHRKELEQLAAVGFLAVGVDAAGHGERALPSLRQRLDDATQREALGLMLPLVELTARDVPLVVKRLCDEGLADERRIALVGISMGAFVVYRAIALVQGIRAAVALLGSPEWPEGVSPHRSPEAFRYTALLSITAEKDTNVPSAGARRFHAALERDSSRIAPAEHLKIRDAEHLMSESQWRDAMEATVDWLRRHNV